MPAPKYETQYFLPVLPMPYKTRRDAQIFCRAISGESNFGFGIIIWLIPRAPGSENHRALRDALSPGGGAGVSTRSASGIISAKPGGRPAQVLGPRRQLALDGTNGRFNSASFSS